MPPLIHHSMKKNHNKPKALRWLMLFVVPFVIGFPILVWSAGYVLIDTQEFDYHEWGLVLEGQGHALYRTEGATQLLLNGKIDLGQNVRVFPISNWTELDVWSYIQKENIEIPSIYFAHLRKVFLRDGMVWSANDAVVYRDEEELVEERMVRFRTVGDMSCTAAVLSEAVDIAKVVEEIRDSSISERGARIDDKRSEAAMEKRKQQGYF